MRRSISKEEGANMIQPKYTTGNRDMESRMVQFLDDESLFNLCLTNKAIAKVCRNDAVWEKRILERFPSFHSLKPQGVSYRNYYLRIISHIHNLLGTLEIEGIVSNERELADKLKNKEDGALIQISKLGYLELARYLIEKVGINPHSDEEGILMEASEMGHLELIRYLIEKAGSNPHILNEEALLLATQTGHLPVVRYLIEKTKADPHINFEAPLRWASSEGHLPVVQYLIEQTKADPHVFDEAPLNWAVRDGRLPVVQYLIEQVGVDPHVVNEENLVWASSHGHLPVVQYIAKKLESIKNKTEKQ